ncbi:hypothetical protein TNCV_3728901 [Trichonephila clavipes]|nr:hypothetical protein TNCV_3728901 [Trichonephila clavipes]
MTRLSLSHLLPEVGKNQSTLPMMWGQCGHSSDCTILAIICVPGDVLTLRDGTLYLLRSTVANTEQLPYRSDRGGGRYVYSTNLLPLRPIIRPYQSPSAARTAAGYVLEGILSLNIVYQSHQIRLDSRTALVLMLLNSPSCATNMRIAH